MEQCPICLNHFHQLHEHHIYPTGYGGDPDGKLLSLCSACHLNIHHQAENWYGKQEKRYFLTLDQIERARPYIKVIMLAKQKYEETKHLDTNANKKIVLTLNQQTLVRVHKRKKDLGFKSVDKYIEALVLNDIKNL